MAPLTDPDRELTLALERLSRRFPDVSERWLGELARTVHAGFRDAPIRAFVPVLVEHGVVTRVRRSSAVPMRSCEGSDGLADWIAEVG